MAVLCSLVNGAPSSGHAAETASVARKAAPDGESGSASSKPMGWEPEGGYGGYGSKRVESEYSIHVPLDMVDDVWGYLSSAYGGGANWPAAVDRKTYSARLADEQFLDRYFDTPSLTLLASQDAVRHRMRFTPGEPDDPKNDRQLVQIKVTTDRDTVTRGEYKYPVRQRIGKRMNPDGHPVLDLVRRRYREPFSRMVQQLGVDPKRLDEVLRLDQRRRRVYLGDSGGMVLTVTLDQVTARKWWIAAPWTEVEVEINEVRYTEASPEDRARLEGLRAAVRNDLLNRFPMLLQDDQPKYNEAFSLVERRLPLLRRAISVREGVPLPLALVLASGMVLSSAVVIGLRHRRTRRPSS